MASPADPHQKVRCLRRRRSGKSPRVAAPGRRRHRDHAVPAQTEGAVSVQARTCTASIAPVPRPPSAAGSGPPHVGGGIRSFWPGVSSLLRTSSGPGPLGRAHRSQKRAASVSLQPALQEIRLGRTSQDVASGGKPPKPVVRRGEAAVRARTGQFRRLRDPLPKATHLATWLKAKTLRHLGITCQRDSAHAIPVRLIDDRLVYQFDHFVELF